MASGEPPRPASKTSSRCVLQTSRGTHKFEVTGYSLQPSLGAGYYVTSPAFDVGGYRWCLRFYPCGSSAATAQEAVHAGLFLELLTKPAVVNVLYDLRLVDQTTGTSHSIFRPASKSVFTTVDESKKQFTWGIYKFMKRSELDASVYLRDDRLLIECDVTVVSETRVMLDMADVELPPSELSMDLARLLETGEGADVTFSVKGEEFRAHKMVLAARSSVFKAALFGPVGEDNRQCVSVEDMQPATFRALLHFVYTDSLPSMEDLDDGDCREFVKHLLVAADRYAVERLKLICEGILSKSLDVESVAALLVLSDQYNCRKLKDACHKYILSNRADDAVPSQEVKRSTLTVFWNRASSLVSCCTPFNQ